MNLARSGLLNSLAVGSRMVVGFIINKMLAYFVGPAGYAIIGQYQNVVTMANSVMIGAVQNGVVRYTTEFSEDEPRQHALWRTAVGACFLVSLVVGGGLVAFSRPLSGLLLKSPNYSIVISLLGASLFLSVLNVILLSVLNGKKEIPGYVAANVGGNILVLATCAWTISRWGLVGALISLGAVQGIMLIATLAVIARRPWFRIHYFVGRIDLGLLRKMGAYFLMAGVSAIVVPLCMIGIRETLVRHLGMIPAGLWQGTWRLSEIYLSFVTTTLMVYYLPRIAEIHDPRKLRQEVVHVARLVVPVIAAMSCSVWILRRPIIQLLFSNAFLPMEQLFLWQFAGDLVKIIGWLLGYIALGRAMVSLYVLTECLFSLLLVGLTTVLVPILGLKGAPIAYLVNYIIYAIFMALSLKRAKILA